MTKTFLFFSALLVSLSFSALANNFEDTQKTKEKILSLAQKYQGQGDPDLKIQKELQPLVDKLLTLNPQPKVKDRLDLLYGTWKQVWGPYNYRDNKRGVDSSLKADEIYQVISPLGFYYNVNPNLDKKKGNVQRIDFLKGEYVVSPTNPNGLNVQFVKYIGMKNRPTDKNIFEYIEEAEKNQLPNQITVVPRFIVKLFFGGGTLVEVYTDENLRILYGTNNKEFQIPYLYIMTKVSPRT